MKNSLLAIFLSILLVAPAYADSTRLDTSSNATEFWLGYTQQNLRDWHGEGTAEPQSCIGRSQSCIGRIDYVFDNSTISLMPGMIFMETDIDGFENFQNASLYLRYMKVGTIPWINMGYFFTVGLGGISEQFPNRNVSLRAITGQFQNGVGIFYNLKIGQVLTLRPFCGGFFTKGASNRTLTSETFSFTDSRFLGEIGLEIRYATNRGLFGIVDFPLDGPDRTFYIGIRFY